MPVLLVVGSRDDKYVDIAVRMEAAIPNARVEIIEGAGHACHLEQPDDFRHLLTTR
jgi:2-succinyl-6-hydroxy-2,4-cyclohexadiene-1-carboxylate synthase